METLASVWTCDPCDLRDPGHAPPCVCESVCVCHRSPPAGRTWAQQLSPHLQRNQQLQDTLLQREEELARLQEENNYLREFLNSSFVRNLEEKAKRLHADGRRNLKRSLKNTGEGTFQDSSCQILSPQQANKRVCRNLTATFCSESSETSSSSEPNLDLWVLRTLGLKDHNTIDASLSSTSTSTSHGCSLGGLVDNAAATSSSSSSSDSSVSPLLSPSVQRPTRWTEYRSSSTGYREPAGDTSRSLQSSSTRPSHSSYFSVSWLPRPCEGPEPVPRSYNAAFQSLPGGLVRSSKIETRFQTQIKESQAKSPAYWSQPSTTSLQDQIYLSPPGDVVPFSPISSSGPVISQQGMSLGSAGSRTPQMPLGRTDLLFSMNLSPSSSVKTHSFSQGQAFIRKDPEGRWNFTWVPRQGPEATC